LKIGLQIYNFDWPGSPQNIGSRLIGIAKTAEKVGFSSLWVMDHFFQIGGIWGAVEAPMLEGYSTMSFLAAQTNSIKLGLMVTGNIYRHPGILIKTVTTLDILSGGRAYLGIGTGWYYREAKGLGVPFPSTKKELVGRLEETLQISHQMWEGNLAPYHGKYYQLDELLNSPQPLSKPHPPIMIGIEKEKKMPRLAAAYADAVNFHLGTPLEEYPLWMRERYHNRKKDFLRKIKVLEECCNNIGRSIEEIELSTLGTIKIAPSAMNTNDLVNLCQELSQLGFKHIIFNMPNVHEITPLETIGKEVIPMVTDL
jgi:F420-dependent oxidoreductase-like protein